MSLRAAAGWKIKLPQQDRLRATGRPQLVESLWDLPPGLHGIVGNTGKVPRTHVQLRSLARSALKTEE